MTGVMNIFFGNIGITRPFQTAHPIKWDFTQSVSYGVWNWISCGEGRDQIKKQDPGDLGLKAIRLSSLKFWTPILDPYFGPLWTHLNPFGPIKT